MFSTDRDLLALEPNLFRDLAWTGQTLASGTADYAGAAMEVTSDPTVEDRHVGAGHVIVVDGVGYEVIDRVGSTELVVSMLRADVGGALIPPPKMLGRPAYISTFAPQAALAHRQVLRCFDLDAEGGPGAAAVRNPRDLARLEALGTLYLIYAAASAVGGEDGPLAQRREMYRERFARARDRAVAMLDLDGDGVAETVRHSRDGSLVRG